MGKAIGEVYWALRGTQEGRYGCLSVGVTAKLIECLCGIPCLHAPKVHSKSDSCGGLEQAYCLCRWNLRGETGAYHGYPGTGFVRQDYEVSKGVMAAPRSG